MEVASYEKRNACWTVQPFFLGLTLGGFTTAGFWLIIDFFTGMHGNVFTLS